MKLFRRRTDEPLPTLSYDPLLQEMRGGAEREVYGWGFTPERRLADVRYQTSLAEERAEQLRALGALEQAQHELALVRERQRAELESAQPPRPEPGLPPRPWGERAHDGRADDNGLSPSPSTPAPPAGSERSDDELVDILRAIRDRPDPEHPSGVMPPQAVVREEVKVGFRRLRRLLDRLTAEEDELRRRRGA